MTNDRAASVLFLFTGIYGLYFSLQLPMGRWNEPGSGVFPLALSILLLISGGSWFISGRRKAGEKGKGNRGDGYASIKKLATPLKIVGLTLLFILAFSRAGYLVTSSLYIFILLLWVSRYRIIVSIGLALAIGAGSSYFFEKILSVPLPQGILSF